MDSTSNGMSWVSKLCQKTETFFDEVDVLITQEPLKYVENHLLAAGENVKQYCSEFIKDVLELSEEEVPSSETEKSGVLASETPNIGLGNEHQKVSCNSGSSVQGHWVEEIEELCKVSSLTGQHDTGMSIGIQQNTKGENLFTNEIPEVIASANEDANDISVSCGMRQPNKEVSDDQVNLSTAAPKLVGDNPLSESRVMSRAAHRKDDVSTLAPEFGTCMILTESQTPSDSDSYDRIHHFSKLSAPTSTPISKQKLDDSCIIVESNEISSASESKHLYRQKYLRSAFSSILKFARERKHYKATFSEDLEKSDKPGGRHISPALATAAFESMNEDFCESEWEII